MKRIILITCVLLKEISGGMMDGVTIKAQANLSWDLKNVSIDHYKVPKKENTLSLVR